MISAITAALALATTPCPQGAQCVEEGNILVVSRDAVRAGSVLTTAQAASTGFEAVFGVSPVRTAIVEDIDTYPGLALELQALGYAVKPWISPDAMRATLEAQIRPALQASMPDAPPAQIEATLNATIDRRMGQNDDIRHGDAIIAHELGHIWLMHAYDWPPVDTGGVRTYGAAAAPDWMDEIAAVLMESEALTAQRREALCAELPESLPLALDAYFTMDHPLLAMAREAAARREAALAAAGGEAPSGPQIMVLSGSDAMDAQGQIASPAYYYAVTRALIDYMGEAAGSEAVFADLAPTLAAGGTLDGWLAGGVAGLPESEDALAGALHDHIVQACPA